MKTDGGVHVYIHVFLTSALVGGELSASRPGRFTPGERASCTHWIGGWVGPGTGLDDVERRKFMPLPGLELRPLGCPTRSAILAPEYHETYLNKIYSYMPIVNLKRISTPNAIGHLDSGLY
jgi:hypothetical protein